MFIRRPIYQRNVGLANGNGKICMNSIDQVSTFLVSLHGMRRVACDASVTFGQPKGGLYLYNPPLSNLRRILNQLICSRKDERA